MIGEPVTDRLLRGPAYGLRNWPAAMTLVHQGLAKVDTSRFYEQPVNDAPEGIRGEPLFRYELTDKGRRKAAHYRFQAAGHGK